MLSKFILRAGATAVALTFAAGPASADNFRVLMLDYAFFPEISYVSPGDTITFVNLSGMTRTIVAQNEEWVIEDLADGNEATLPIVQGMKNQYTTISVGTPNADTEAAEEGAETSEGDEIVVGKLNFSGAAEVVLD